MNLRRTEERSRDTLQDVILVVEDENNIRANMIAFLEANASYCIKPSLTESLAKAYVFVGEKENKAMHKSAKLIHENLPESTLRALPNMYHGEFSINHADDYVNEVSNIIWERDLE